jgi:hypothetical protein
MTLPEVRKQVSIFVPLSDWRALREEAARRRIPMTELCRGWMKPHMDRLRRRGAGRPGCRPGGSPDAADRAMRSASADRAA